MKRQNYTFQTVIIVEKEKSRRNKTTKWSNREILNKICYTDYIKGSNVLLTTVVAVDIFICGYWLYNIKR